MSDYLIALARKSAQNSELLQKHGSILICGEQLSSGYNHFKYNKNYKHNKPTKLNIAVHAEEDAINNFILYSKQKHNNDMYIRRQLNKATLITIRVKNDNLKNSAPCKHCIELIRKYGIKNIIYSDNNITFNTTPNNIVIDKHIIINNNSLNKNIIINNNSINNNSINIINNNIINDNIVHESINNINLIKKKSRDIEHIGESSGYRWRAKLNT